VTISIVICTRNRPADLGECLRSIAWQTRRPDEIVIVDASDDEASAARSRELAPHLTPVPVRHLHAARGLPHQRNLGVRASRGEVVTFLDDDVILDRGYLAAIVPLFEADPHLGGAEGVVDTPPLRGRRRLANDVRRFFAMNTLGRPRGVKRSGFVAYDPWPGEVRRVGSLVGCNMSYRRAVFAEFGFDEWYQGYALGEDQDFSYRVGRRFGLAQTPAARLVHRLSPVARETLPALHEMTAVHHYYFVRKNLPPGLRTWAAFAWSELGELLSVAKTLDAACVAAKVRGYRRIARGLPRGRAR
jgi:glycosyltransferase involved in cell wall biosynthesis